MEIRKIAAGGMSEAMDLVWKVFSKFEAPEYSAEGAAAFRDFISSREVLDSLTVYGAFEGETLMGVIAMRDVSHISLFFVREEHHRKGVGRALFEHAALECGIKRITVNSSPYAVPVYRALGFSQTAGEQLQDGIRYTPMEYEAAE